MKEDTNEELEFMVLQGIPGGADCLTNTMDSVPTLSETDDDDDEEDARIIAEWNETRRRNELILRSEWLEETMAQHKAFISTATTTTSKNSNKNNTQLQQAEDDLFLLTSCESSSHWWFVDKQTGYLAILDGIPKRILQQQPDDDDLDIFASSVIDYPHKIGMVPPGTKLKMATKQPEYDDKNHNNKERIITLNTRDLQRVQNNTRNTDTDEIPRNGRKGQIQIMRIQEPMEGYVVVNLHGYPYVTKYSDSPLLGGGEDPWYWRVVCIEGAWIREGLGLGTEYVATAPYGATVSVHDKTVDTHMGLSRIRVSYSLYEKEEEDGIKNKNNGERRINETLRTQRTIQGWASEYLNPLSGQRGPILCPIPFPRPAIYKVLEECEIHESIETESRIIGKVPAGTWIPITGRAFTNREHATERLRLAGNGGWISRTRNITLDEDDNNEEQGTFMVTIPIAEFVKYDDNFDPWHPGRYHLQALRSIQKAQYNQSHQEVATMTTPRNRIRAISSGSDTDMGDEDSVKQTDNVLHRGNFVEDTSTPVLEDLLRCYYRKKAARPHVVDNATLFPIHQTTPDYQHCCVICLSSKRNATIVHGETGHVACCLACARILAARGDACPVCRKPIERVIEHFYA
jgi:E3 ubiquitin-protein ligase Mdm2